MNNKTTTFNKKLNCHTGNSIVYQHDNDAALMIGGWNNGAVFDHVTHVIDLTGTEHKFWDIPFAYDDQSKAFLPFLVASYAGWLSLPFPDFGVPARLNTRAQWEGIARTVLDILNKGNHVLVACHGGHGRSGLFCAIVGYLLHSWSESFDRTWNSPVEKIRDLHCSEAVETFNQERFVYDILGLNIQITRSYANPSTWKYEACPICGTQSMFVDEIGMCKGCETKFSAMNIPVRKDLTLKDIENKGLVDHNCTNTKCLGIWRAEKCGHVIHDMVVYEGWCTTCWEKHQEEIEYAEAQIEDGYDDEETCAICGSDSIYAHRFGVCYDCQEEIITNHRASQVHNSITDPYGAVAHDCNNVSCVGIIQADVCKHIVHNREAEDGLCPSCRYIKKAAQ